MDVNIFDLLEDLDARALFNSIKNDPDVDHITFDKFNEWYPEYLKKIQSLPAQTPLHPVPLPVTASSAKRGVQLNLTEPKVKKSKTIEENVPETLSAGKKTALLKAIANSLKSSIKGKKFYNYGSGEECSGEAVMSPSEFNAIFGSIGTVELPVDKSGAAKPLSKVVALKNFTTAEVEALFGKLLEKITVDVYNRPRSFEKQIKTGKSDITISTSSLQYSSNTQTCKMKFACKSQGSGGYGMWW